MIFQPLLNLYKVYWMFKANGQQRLGWKDAVEARVARARADAQAAAQLQAMLDANPSGSLGNATLNDETALKQSGLL